MIMPRYDTESINCVEENSPAINHRHEHSRKRKLLTYAVENDDTWLCATISVPTLLRRYVGIARLKHATNLGPTREGKYKFLAISVHLVSFYSFLLFI